MALVAVLGLLFGAVAFQVREIRRSREAARRSQCVNNLKQIGLAIARYESDLGVYPAGTVANPGLPVARRLGWNYLLAPYLDFRGDFASRELTKSWDDPSFQSLQSRPPICETCPSKPDGKSASYAAIAGLGVDAPSLPKQDKRAGIFGDNRIVTTADVSDGLANTMMVAESSAPSGPWFAGGRHTVRGLDPARQPYIGVGRQFGGIHREGANVLMADGSVRFVREFVAPKVFEAASTMAGGEKVSAP